MSGNIKQLFEKQQAFQKMVTGLEQIPQDSPQWFQYHMTAMTEELGEVLKADKRWKTHRNVRYEPAEKLEEIADVFITSMNIAIFSDFSAEEVYEAIDKKIRENINKLIESKRSKENE